jgi:hypothetical protein
MSFTVTHRSGATEHDPPTEQLDALIAELDEVDQEHPDVALSHESGWTLSAFTNGRVFWENVQQDEPARLMGNVECDRLRELFLRLARGEITLIEAEPWEAV